MRRSRLYSAPWMETMASAGESFEHRELNQKADQVVTDTVTETRPTFKSNDESSFP